MAELKFGYGRVVHQDYSDQLFRRLFRDVKQYTVETMLENMEKMAYEVLRTAYAEKEFISVTGNLMIMYILIARNCMLHLQQDGIMTLMVWFMQMDFIISIISGIHMEVCGEICSGVM